LSGFDLNSGWNCTATYQGCDGSSTISTNLPSSERPEICRPLVGQRLLVEAVELVAVPMPLVDDVLAVELCASRARRQPAGVRAEPHRAAQVVDAEQVAQLVDDVLGVSGAHSVESASAGRTRAGVLDGRPLEAVADPEVGDAALARDLGGAHHPARPAIAEARRARGCRLAPSSSCSPPGCSSASASTQRMFTAGGA
jgi:hypothetical protein